MRDGKQVLPPGWQKRVLAAAAAALAGNLLVNVIPWPGSLLSSYEQAMIPAIYRRAELLWMTLVLAPILEEGAFRLVLYGWLRRFMAFLPAAVISSLAFGISWKLDSRHIRIPFGNGAGMGL